MKKFWILIVVPLILTANLATAADSGPVIEVTGGRIQGAPLSKGGAVFKGIPYSRPPVGDLRWREPMPVKPWPGVLHATKFGPMCPQKPSLMAADAAKTTAEDCLSLNVWTPEWPAKSRLPVMVWIPGGGNFIGGSAWWVYDGEPLARRGVVLVSFNYRLGPFGFFSHPSLTRESPHRASGNQGILDQIAALKWVRDNIARFGGDPGNVTIFGESAGSVNASMLMASPLSKGLFRRVIGESGAAILPGIGSPQSLRDAEMRGRALAASWKASPNTSLKELREIPASNIIEKEPDYLANGDALAASFPNIGITVDGYVFPRTPAEVFAAGQQHRVDLLFGSNAHEQIPGVTPPANLEKAIAQTYGPLARRAQALYGSKSDPQYGTPLQQWATDTSFRCSAVTQLIWHAAAGNTAFEYEFARVPKGTEALGATHGLELTYVFGTSSLGLLVMGPPTKATEADDRLSDLMQRYWTNFAKTGNPNGKDLPVWPKFDASSRAYIQFTDSDAVVKEGLRRPHCDLFIENVKRRQAR